MRPNSLLWGLEEWDRLIDSIRRALNRQSYWIKEVLVITADKLSAQKEPPLMTIQIEETQIVMKAKNASKTLPLADAETEESIMIIEQDPLRNDKDPNLGPFSPFKNPIIGTPNALHFNPIAYPNSKNVTSQLQRFGI